MATNALRNGQFGISDFYKTLDGQLHPEPLFRTRRGRCRSTIRVVTTSSLTLADALDSEKPTPGDEQFGWNEEISLVTVPPTDELILTNGAEHERWDTYNKQPYNVLFWLNNSPTRSFPVHVAGRPDSRQQPNGHAAWEAMTEKISIH